MPQRTYSYALYQDSNNGRFHFPICIGVDKKLYIETDSGLEYAVTILDVKVGDELLNLKFVAKINEQQLNSRPTPAPATAIPGQDRPTLTVERQGSESSFDAMKRASAAVMATAIADRDNQRATELAKQQNTLSPRAQLFKEANLQSIRDKH